MVGGLERLAQGGLVCLWQVAWNSLDQLVSDNLGRLGARLLDRLGWLGVCLDMCVWGDFGLARKQGWDVARTRKLENW